MDPHVVFARIFQALKEESLHLQNGLHNVYCEEDVIQLGNRWASWVKFLQQFFGEEDVLEQGHTSFATPFLSPFQWWAWRQWLFFWLLPFCFRVALWWWAVRCLKRRWAHQRRWLHFQQVVRSFRRGELSRPSKHTSKASPSSSSSPYSTSCLSFPLQKRGRRRLAGRQSTSFFSWRLWGGWAMLFLAFLCFSSVLCLYPLVGYILEVLLSSLPFPSSWISGLKSLLFVPSEHARISGGEGRRGVEQFGTRSSMFPSILFAEWLPHLQWYYKFLHGVHQYISLALITKYLYVIVPVFIGLVFAAVFQASALVEAITSYGYGYTASLAKNALRWEEESAAAVSDVSAISASRLEFHRARGIKNRKQREETAGDVVYTRRLVHNDSKGGGGEEGNGEEEKAEKRK